MAKTIGDFFDEVGGGAEAAFRAEPWYNTSGDSIHYHWEPADYYGDRIDDKLTLYRSLEGREIVGCEIKGVSALLRKFGDFGIAVQDDCATLAMYLFVSNLIAEFGQYDPQERREAYLYLVEKHGKTKLPVPEMASQA
jgi:hypothetical protein